MCFSATASFAVAAATAATGLAVLHQAREWRALPLALVPFLFAAQQAIEGLLWLDLAAEGGGRHVTALSFAFLLFAKVLWPAYAAAAVLSVEPDPRRRRFLRLLGAVGAALSLYLLVGLLIEPPSAVIHGHSLDYTGQSEPLSWEQLPYVLCTGLALLLSSHRAIRGFGIAILAGYLVAGMLYAAAFVSVWCFFAAFCSTLLYFHFRGLALATRLPGSTGGRAAE